MSPEITPLSILNCGGAPGGGHLAANCALAAINAFSAFTTTGMAAPIDAPMQLFGVLVPGCAPVQSVEGLKRLDPSIGLMRNGTAPGATPTSGVALPSPGGRFTVRSNKMLLKMFVS